MESTPSYIVDSTPSLWLPDSPFKSPAWRWLRASWLHVRRKRVDPSIDDEWVERAMGFLALRSQGTGRRARPKCLPHDVDAVAAALDLWQAPNPQRRWLLEAYLLTAAPLTEVAGHCTLPVAVVEAYHSLFFTCRDHLAAKDWIMVMAIGGLPGNGFGKAQQPGAFWKWTAFATGPRALEVVIATTTGQPFPAWFCASCQNAAYREAQLRVLIKLTYAMLTAQTPEELGTAVEGYESLRRLQASATGSDDRLTGTLAVMAEFVKSLGGRPRRRKAASKKQMATPQDRGRGHETECRESDVVQGVGT